MHKLEIHEGVYVKKSSIHGWGVFTNLNIKKGEIVEECIIPYELIPINSNVLSQYRYVWPSRKNWSHYCIALGFGSIYNHSKEKMNINWKINKEQRIMVFTAIKDIKIGEELLFNYDSSYFN
jgi:SET domain-containing protein